MMYNCNKLNNFDIVYGKWSLKKDERKTIPKEQQKTTAKRRDQQKKTARQKQGILHKETKF